MFGRKREEKRLTRPSHTAAHAPTRRGLSLPEAARRTEPRRRGPCLHEALMPPPLSEGVHYFWDFFPLEYFCERKINAKTNPRRA